MTMELAFWIIFVGTAIAAVTILVYAISRGRVRPDRTWPWVIAAVIMVGGLALNLVVLIGSLLAGNVETTWLLPASLSLAAATVLMFVEPRWAAWTLAVTAALIPGLVFLATLVVDNPEMGRDLLPAMLMFYSARSLVAAGLLWWATVPARGARPRASRSPTLRSEIAPIG